LIDSTTGEDEGEEEDDECFHCVSTSVLHEVDLDLNGGCLAAFIVDLDRVTHTTTAFEYHEAERVLNGYLVFGGGKAGISVAYRHIDAYTVEDDTDTLGVLEARDDCWSTHFDSFTVYDGSIIPQNLFIVKFLPCHQLMEA
jgi:hypothetical protein